MGKREATDGRSWPKSGRKDCVLGIGRKPPPPNNEYVVPGEQKQGDSYYS